MTPPSTSTVEIAGAYSATGAAWDEGPARVYGRMAAELVDRCPGGVAGRRVLDLGAGSGLAGLAARNAGAVDVVAVDAAVGMLRTGRNPPKRCVAGDALALPLADGTVGAVVAAFSLNHLADPATGVRESLRVLRPGGGFAASAYAADDTHPVKAATDAAAEAKGWRPPGWYEWIRTEATWRLATVDAASEVLASVGVDGATEHVEVRFDDLDPADLVAWRLGMAHLAPFVAALSPGQRDALVDDALARLGDASPPLVRRLVVITATR